MAMQNPPHPGEFILATYLEPLGLSHRYLAEKLNVAVSSLNNLLNGQIRLNAEMALRLPKALGRSPESWLSMQNSYDLWVAKQNIELDTVNKIKLFTLERKLSNRLLNSNAQFFINLKPEKAS